MLSRTQLWAAEDRRLRSMGGQGIPLPLPLGGLFAEAKTADVGPVFASKLDDVWLDGLSVKTRPPVAFDLPITSNFPARQRFPFNFGGVMRTIACSENVIEVEGVEIPRSGAKRAMASEISSHVLIADGGGAPVRYNGTTLEVAGFTSGDVNVAELDGVTTHHDRAFFWKRNGGTLDFYYAGLGAITGPLTRFPLSRLGNIRGTIMTISSFTIDAGHGANDVLCIFTTAGQVVVYEGLDPGDPQDWRLWGRASIPAPLSPFAMAQVGADLWVTTCSGVLSMTAALRQAEQALVNNMSRPIIDLIEDAAHAANDLDAFQMVASPDGAVVILNMPDGDTYQQLIYISRGRAWVRWTVAAQWWHEWALGLRLTGLDGAHGRLDMTRTVVEDRSIVWHSNWFRGGRMASIGSMTPEIFTTGALTLTVAMLTNKTSTPRDIEQAKQIVTLTPQDETYPEEQVLDDVIAVGAVGDSFQIRLHCTGNEIEITGITLFR